MSLREDLAVINKHQKEFLTLGRVNTLLDWDEQVLMPKDGSISRSEQTALISKYAHEKIISGELYRAVERLRKINLSDKQKVIADKLHKDIEKSRKLPLEFVEEMSRAVTRASSAWREARVKKSFEMFRPFLKKIIDLKVKESSYIGMNGHPYNSLLDDYEEGMTAEKLRSVFGKLKLDLRKLLDKIEASEVYKKKKRDLVQKKFDKETQMFFVRDVAKRMGMSDEGTRIDFSEHPFTTRIGVGDVRVTTNVRKDPLFAFGSTIHECGHALYESGLPKEDEYNVLGDAPSLGLHESQSRFWENMVGKSKHFWKFYFPKFNKEFRLNGKFDDWYREVNFVFPGKIRIESDEVHYCLHVILRLEAELGLIGETLSVKELPVFWNEKMREFFGVTPKNDVEGVLQDVHWSGGSVGYFPTYAIGTIYAAQLYEKIIKEKKGIEGEIEKGKFDNVREWLREKVHKYGSRHLAEEIIQKAVGEGLNPDVYIRYLKRKYGEIYGL